MDDIVKDKDNSEQHTFCSCYLLLLCLTYTCVCAQDMVQLMSVDRRKTAVSPVDSLKQLRERLREEREEAVRMIHAGELLVQRKVQNNPYTSAATDVFMFSVVIT